MDGTSTPRRVLVLEGEPAMRNLLYVLLAALRCEGDVAHSGQQALAMIERHQFDAMLLDLRCFDVHADEVMSRIREVRPSLVGRVLFITSEVSDPQTMEFIARHCAPHVSCSRLMEELWDRLRALLGPSPAPHPASESRP